MIDQTNINVPIYPEPFPESNEEVEAPFLIGKYTIDSLIGKYLSRKMCEELDFLEAKGGINGLAHSLKTSISAGLSDNEQELFLRINAFDSNEPPPQDPVSYCRFVWEALEDKIIRCLILCGLAKTIIEITLGENPKDNWIDGVAIIMAILVVVLVGSINNYIKEKEFQNLKKLMESDKYVAIIRNNEEHRVNQSEILVGDLMKIEEGMTIPVDCILIQGSNIYIDESAMTGEIDAIEKLPYEEALRKKDLFIRENSSINTTIQQALHHKISSSIIPSGTKVSSGSGTVLILTVGPNTEIGKIMATTEANKSSEEGTPLQQKLTAIATFIGKLGTISAILIAVAMSIRLIIKYSSIDFTYKDIHYIVKIFITAVVVIVVAIPEGLPLAVTISLAFSVKKMLNDKNFVRRMEACETMGGCDFICTDKTGTLTKNEMNIIKINDGVNDIDLLPCLGVNGNDERKYFVNPNIYHLLRLCFACNTETTITKDGGESATFKTDLTFTKFLRIFGEDIEGLRKTYIHEICGTIPRIGFSSRRKKMSTVLTSEEFPTGYRIFTKGASEIVLNSCHSYIDENNKIQNLTDFQRLEIQKIIKSFAIDTLRTVCVAYKDIDSRTAEKWNEKAIIEENENSKEIYPIEQKNFIFIGVIGIQDVLKDRVPISVKDCQTAGITVVMVTGDNIDTAMAVAKNSNICQEVDPKYCILGESFMAKIGGIVCENCFPKEQFQNIIEDNRRQKIKNDYQAILAKLNYSCHCYRTRDEGVKKIMQKLKEEKIKEQSYHMKSIISNKEAYKKFQCEIEEQAKKQFDTSGAKLKKDVVANIEKFKKIINRIRVIARSQPHHKYALVTGLKQLNHVVAVTGDGTNDAPALSKADVGFAMGKMGTDIAKEAADIIILDDNFASIVSAIKWGRNIYDNVRRFLQFQLSVNIVTCALVFIGVTAAEESPLSAVQMLWLNMIMDSLGSLALATEGPTDALLRRLPYKRNEFIVNKKMFKHIFGQAILQLVILVILLFLSPRFIYETSDAMREYGYAFIKCFKSEINNVISFTPPLEDKNIFLISGFESYFASRIDFTEKTLDSKTFALCNRVFAGRRNLNEAFKYMIEENNASTHYTIIFNTFVIMQLFNQINCRILDDSFNIFRGIFQNYLFLFIMAIEMITQVLIIHFTGPVFMVCKNGLSWYQWGICTGFAALTFVINIMIKFIPDTFSKSSFNKELKISEGKILNIKKDYKLRQQNAFMNSQLHMKPAREAKLTRRTKLFLAFRQESALIKDKRPKLSYDNIISMNFENRELCIQGPLNTSIP